MRRYLLYLAVGLLAFGIGAASVYLYFYRPEENGNSSKAETKSPAFQFQDAPPIFAPRQQNARMENREKEYLSDKETASILFEPTIKKWLGNQKIEAVVEPSAETIGKIVDGEFNRVDEIYLTLAVQKFYKPGLIDVNGDGANELAILSGCEGSESCELWILKRTGKDFAVILKSFQEVMTFSLEKTKTKGYFNIKTTDGYPESSTSMSVKIYKFDDGQYYIFDCFDYEFRYQDKNGKLHNLKKPKFYRLHCC